MHFLNQVDEADLIKLMDEEEDADSSADEEYTISTQYNKYIEAVSRNEKSSKNPFRTFYIAVMHYGVWLLILLKYAAKQAEKLDHGLTYINLFEKNIEYC